jgi:hypothetical protein
MLSVSVRGERRLAVGLGELRELADGQRASSSE